MTLFLSFKINFGLTKPVLEIPDDKEQISNKWQYSKLEFEI
jgi:hypothetical protein